MNNILTMLTTKDKLSLIDSSMSLRQAIEKFKAHHFSAVPVINKDTGEYIGTISDGDLLWASLDKTNDDLKDIKVKDLIRKDYCEPVKVGESYETLLKKIVNQNFVPIIDDRNVLMGIITRKSIINHLINH